MTNAKNLYISVEGPDGCGKTTMMPVIAKVLEAILPVIMTREPGGPPASLACRELLVEKDYDLDKRTRLMLFLCARMESLNKIVLPGLRAGNIVLTDRYSDSTAVFQGHVENMGDTYNHILNIPDFKTLSIRPDYTFYFKASKEICAQRSKVRGEDYMDKLWGPHDLSKAYADHFAIVNKFYPGIVKTIDANQSIENVSSQISEAVEEIKAHMCSGQFTPGNFGFLEKYANTKDFYDQ
jgi:dTMP kinase